MCGATLRASNAAIGTAFSITAIVTLALILRVSITAIVTSLLLRVNNTIISGCFIGKLHQCMALIIKGARNAIACSAEIQLEPVCQIAN